MRLALVLAFVLGALAVVAQPAAAQCAMCQTAVTGSPEVRALSGHLNNAVLLMFFAPYSVVASFLLLAFRHRIRRRARAFLSDRFPSPRPQRTL